MNWLCKVFGHKIEKKSWGMKWCSRCEEILDWGMFTKYIEQTKYPVKIPKSRMVEPGDL